MALVDKDRLVAEIERRIKSCTKQREDMLDVQCCILADDAYARIGELRCLKDFLDTLEVKEVDLDKMLTGFMSRYAYENGGEYPSAIEIAEHFYTFGLAQKEK